MSKKNADSEKEEEKDLDEEEEDEDEDEDEEEDEEAPAASAKAGDARKAHARPRSTHHDDDDDEDEEEEDEDEEDSLWWTPHAVLSALVLIGVLGFFGVFNKVLAGIAVKPSTSPATAVATTSKPAEAHPADAHPAEQRQEYSARHLLVQYKGSQRAAPSITRTEEEAKARATEAMKKARAGTPFEDLVKEYSDEPGAAQRLGDLGKFHKGQMVPEFQNAVEKLKVGEISDLVKTQFGYHVIKRTL